MAGQIELIQSVHPNDSTSRNPDMLIKQWCKVERLRQEVWRYKMSIRRVNGLFFLGVASSTNRLNRINQFLGK